MACNDILILLYVGYYWLYIYWVALCPLSNWPSSGSRLQSCIPHGFWICSMVYFPLSQFQSDSFFLSAGIWWRWQGTWELSRRRWRAAGALACWRGLSGKQEGQMMSSGSENCMILAVGGLKVLQLVLTDKQRKSRYFDVDWLFSVSTGRSLWRACCCIYPIFCSKSQCRF